MMVGSPCRPTALPSNFSLIFFHLKRKPPLKTIVLMLITGIAAMLTHDALAQNYSGQWLGTITTSLNRCEDLGKAEPGDYKLTIVHKDNEILLMDNVAQRPYKGVIDPNRPRNVRVQGAYSVDGGYVTEMVDIVFESGARGTGQSVWNWSDGYHQCGGRFAFELTFIRQ